MPDDKDMADHVKALKDAGPYEATRRLREKYQIDNKVLTPYKMLPGDTLHRGKKKRDTRNYAKGGIVRGR